jgi:hypothetical protein
MRSVAGGEAQPRTHDIGMAIRVLESCALAGKDITARPC